MSSATAHVIAFAEVQAENERLRAQVARLRATLQRADHLAWAVDRGRLPEQIAKLVHDALAETEVSA